MEIEQEFRKGKGNSLGYYINGAIQWSTGFDYYKYTSSFNQVYLRMFPENKAAKTWKNILIIGGGDCQLLSECNFLSYDNRITMVDPNVYEYFKELEKHKTKLKHYYKNQKEAFENKAFFTVVPKTIQEFLVEAEETYDLIVVDLVDELAADVDNVYMSQVFDKLLRPHGLMVGYGGLSYSEFMQYSPVVLFEVEEMHVLRQYFPSWEDEGIFYGIRKCNV